MFQIGDQVMHPGAGVCQVADIRRERFSGPARLYYVLHSLYDGGKTTTYVPVDRGEQLLKPRMAPEEIDLLLAGLDLEHPLWIENNTQRQVAFAAILREGRRERLLQLAAELHIRQAALAAQGRRLRAGDERCLREGERQLHEELGWALGLSPQEVAPYVTARLRALGKIAGEQNGSKTPPVLHSPRENDRI